MVEPQTQYRRYQGTYERISESLETVRQSFLSADRFTQKVMLFDSTVYAVTSVQNDISVLRRAFRGYCNADDWEDLRSVMEGVNYGNNKFDYIRHNFDAVFSQHGDSIIDALEDGDSWHAVELMVEHIQGVSYVKAPFVACMLGFTDLMCLDTNVEQMVPDENVKSSDYRSVDEYRSAIKSVKEQFPDLADEVSTFMLQWVVFDSNRGDGVARHEEWFEVMLPGSPFGHQTGLEDY